MTRLTFLYALALALPIAASAENKCGGANIANGPFTYALVTGQPTTSTFVGGGGDPVNTAFTVTAPGPGSVFPAAVPGGQCSATATADIKVFGIKKVAPGTSVDVPLDSALGVQIANAFTITPSSHVFGIGAGTTVAVQVANANVTGNDFGSYVVVIKAQANGSGIGVGSGFEFILNLQPAAQCVDEAPVISILKPTSASKTLGNIKVQIQAYDPVGACASGLKSLTVTVSSAGGTVSNVVIPLTLNNPLPLPAGVMTTGDGVFTPKGGSGNGGTAAGPPFTASNLSGIGTYTITVIAEDNAGRTDQKKVTFDVNYAVAFTKPLSDNGCDPVRLGASCQGKYKWTVKRASNLDPDNYSDGVMIYDQTVVAELVKVSDQASAASHAYGAGAIGSYVKIGDTPVVYKTNFDHPAGLPYGEFQVMVYFTDVDGNRVLQATSESLSF